MNIFECFTYNYIGEEVDLKLGLRVIIPVGNRLATGWIIKLKSEYRGDVKNIIGIIKDEYSPDKNYLDFAKSISSAYLTSVGRILDYSLSPRRKSINNLYFEHKGRVEKLNKFSLSELQRLSEDKIIHFFLKEKCGLLVDKNGQNDKCCKFKGNRFIIGYSRLSYYREIIDYYLSRKKSVLITVPDNLTANYVKTIFEDIDVYNSDMKVREREDLWCEYSRGKVGVVVGGLSAVLLPIKKLDCIISERAGSFNYKMSYYSNLNINLVSKIRAESYNIPFFEGSSAYTTESYWKKSQLIIEDKREKKEVKIDIKMLKSREKRIPDELIELLKSYFFENKKILIIINKIKSNNFPFCNNCKVVQRCFVCNGMITIDDNFYVKCVRCNFEKKDFFTCSKCNTNLSVINDISISSVKEIIKSEILETGIFTLSSNELKDIDLVLKKIKSSKIVISTPVILNPFFKGIFDSIIYVRPESIFNMNEYNAAEIIFSIVSELKELVKVRGVIDIFSTFFFHYSLKFVNDESNFFERELKYREWFMLPPFSNVYNVEIRSRDLRKLGNEMRKIYKKFKDKLKMKRIYLFSRKRIRGNYKGIITAHSQSEAILKSGLLEKKNINIELITI